MYIRSTSRVRGCFRFCTRPLSSLSPVIKLSFDLLVKQQHSYKYMRFKGRRKRSAPPPRLEESGFEVIFEVTFATSHLPFFSKESDAGRSFVVWMDVIASFLVHRLLFRGANN